MTLFWPAPIKAELAQHISLAKPEPMNEQFENKTLLEQPLIVV